MPSIIMSHEVNVSNSLVALSTACPPSGLVPANFVQTCLGLGEPPPFVKGTSPPSARTSPLTRRCSLLAANSPSRKHHHNSPFRAQGSCALLPKSAGFATTALALQSDFWAVVQWLPAKKLRLLPIWKIRQGGLPAALGLQSATAST